MDGLNDTEVHPTTRPAALNSGTTRTVACISTSQRASVEPRKAASTQSDE